MEETNCFIPQYFRAQSRDILLNLGFPTDNIHLTALVCNALASKPSCFRDYTLRLGLKSRE